MFLPCNRFCSPNQPTGKTRLSLLVHAVRDYRHLNTNRRKNTSNACLETKITQRMIDKIITKWVCKCFKRKMLTNFQCLTRFLTLARKITNNKWTRWWQKAFSWVKAWRNENRDKFIRMYFIRIFKWSDRNVACLRSKSEWEKRLGISLCLQY